MKYEQCSLTNNVMQHDFQSIFPFALVTGLFSIIKTSPYEKCNNDEQFRNFTLKSFHKAFLLNGN